MPYIVKIDREKLAQAPEHARPGRRWVPDTAGELNYLFTKIGVEYLEENGLSYQRLNDIVGALECAKLEMYRRVAAQYEDQKITANGDVFPEELTR